MHSINFTCIHSCPGINDLYQAAINVYDVKLAVSKFHHNDHSPTSFNQGEKTVSFHLATIAK